MNVIEQFERAVRRCGDRPALITGLGRRRKALNYAALDSRVSCAAERLRKDGLKPGDRVLLAVPMSPETYVALLAILRAGMVVMFVDPAHGRKTVARCLREHPPQAIVATRRILLLRWLIPELRRIPRCFSAGRDLNCISDQERTSHTGVARATNDAALLTFTSGSTGAPKAVIRTHGFLLQQFAMLRRIARLREDDIDLVAMPMFVLFNLGHGITSVLPACNIKRPGNVNPAKLAEQMVAEKVTRMVASPALLERLTGFCLSKSILLPDMHCISTGGGPVAPALPERVNAVAPNADVLTVYGSTEAEPIASIESWQVSAEDIQRMRGGAGLLVGKPVDGCDVRIIFPCAGLNASRCSARQFADACLEHDCIGEITVSGDHVLQSYVDPARNAESKFYVEDTVWHRTGDSGYFDKQGRLWLVGRCNAAIKDERGTVYPFQVEYALSDFAGLRRAALIADRGERLLVVEMDDKRVTPDRDSLNAQLATATVDRIERVRRIPMDKRHNAKIDYRALRKAMRMGEEEIVSGVDS